MSAATKFSRMSALLLAGAAVATLGGCEIATVVSRSVFYGSGPVVVPATGAYAATSVYAADGPRMAFDNQSTRTIEVRWWVGRADIFEPTGVAEMQTGQHMAFSVEAGKKVACHSERMPWPTGTADAVVRIEVREHSAEGVAGDPVWMELTRPGSYLLRATEKDGAIAYDRPRSKAGIVVLPPDQVPSGRNGVFPVYARQQVSMASNR